MKKMLLVAILTALGLTGLFAKGKVDQPFIDEYTIEVHTLVDQYQLFLDQGGFVAQELALSDKDARSLFLKLNMGEQIWWNPYWKELEALQNKPSRAYYDGKINEVTFNTAQDIYRGVGFSSLISKVNDSQRIAITNLKSRYPHYEENLRRLVIKFRQQGGFSDDPRVRPVQMAFLMIAAIDGDEI